MNSYNELTFDPCLGLVSRNRGSGGLVSRKEPISVVLGIWLEVSK